MLIPLLFLLKAATSANILVCVTLPGSHMYAAVNVANFLGENGHNVTLFTVANETRVNINERQRFTWVMHREIILYNNSMEDVFKVS